MTKHKRSAEGVFLSPETLSNWVPFPSAQTLFHSDLLNPQVRELIAQATAQVDPEIWERDRPDAERIERAATVEALLDLLPIASGTAELAWHRRMGQFGPEAVPLIAERLKRTRDIGDRRLRFLTYEHLLSALRWRGEGGAAALLDCFGDLNDYGKSLACVSLGLLGAQDAADTIWAFYESVGVDMRKCHFVGALWGLIDLQDTRAADALADLLWEGYFFYELFGFLSLAGDAHTVVPLLLVSTIGSASNAEIGQHAGMSLLSIAHRIGREALLTEFQKAAPQIAAQQRHRERMADDILATSPHNAEEYFALFYRGLTAQDIDLTDLERLKKRFVEQEQLGRPARRAQGVKKKRTRPRKRRGGKRWRRRRRRR